VHLPRRLLPRRVAKNSRARSGTRRGGVPGLGDPDRDTPVALVVGLGNPGRKYESTRHNLGRLAAAEVAGRSELLSSGDWACGRLELAACGGRRFLILYPETFMNLSGRAVAPVMARYRIAPDRVLVLHDDIDLPAGDVRLKTGGGTGGHLGLASLVEETGSSDFTRIRIGVGRPPEGTDAADHVLAQLPPEDREVARAAVETAASAAMDRITGE
jgi:peptidyl-tRNA hydrolase, PTH1 family